MTSTSSGGLRRHRVLIASVVLLAAVTGGVLYLRRAPAPTAPASPAVKPPLTVETVAVRRQPAVLTAVAVGTLLANESVVITAETAGRIAAIEAEEGLPVEAGQILFRLDDSVPRAELDQAEASLVLREANYRRAEALLAEHATSQRERDEAYAQWQFDEARVRLARAQLEKMQIRAPFAGTLGLRRVSPGDYVRAGEELVNLEDVARLKVDFQLPEIYAPRVRTGLPLGLATDARPGESFAGTIYAINPKVDDASRSLRLRGVLDNRDHHLSPGQFVRVTLELGREEDALFIPEQAVVPHPERPYVWKVVDGRASMARVALGQRTAGLVQVAGGLAAGDIVITGGIQKVGEGAPVTAVPADPALFAPAAKTPAR